MFFPTVATCFLLLLGVDTVVRGAPTTETSSAAAVSSTVDKSDCSETDKTDFYDQRQNGTDNYRINVDGVVVVVAPAETLLAVAGEFANLAGSGGESDLTGLDPAAPKPTKPTPTSSSPSSSSSAASSTSAPSKTTDKTHQKDLKESIRPEIDEPSRLVSIRD